MRRQTAILAFFLGFTGVCWAQDSVVQARSLEASGDTAAALRALREAAQSGSESSMAAYADFLDRYGHLEARQAYAKLAQSNADAGRKQTALHRLVVLSLIAGEREDAAKHLAAYRAAGGTALPASLPAVKHLEPMPLIEIPGPIRSFSRMAALSPDLKPADILPALARNIVTNGYQASNSQEALEQTEYLKLVFRYLGQARDIEKFAGTSKVLTIETCDSAQTGELLKILGYRMRGSCGADVTLETVNASRAFVTIDSGFPLAELEQALRTNRPFRYDYQPTSIPILYGADYWTAGEKKEKGAFIDTFMSDPTLCRLYLGMAKLDLETADELKKAIQVQRLKAFAHVLDFFGGMFIIRNGRVATPGGAKSEAAWTELVGAPPTQGAQFLDRLISRDDGWLCSYFDSLSRIEGPVANYLTDPERMRRFYTAIRGRVTSPGPARPVFRSNTDLMLLTTRLTMDASGQPHLPGGVETWKNLFVNHPHGKYDGKLTKSAAGWKSPDDVIEALFALCRKAVENEPLKIFMALSDLDRVRRTPLDPATADRLARSWRVAASQFPVFAETGTLSDKTVLQYLDAIEAINEIKNQEVRADAAGTMQALVGIWQVLVRNNLMPAAQGEPALASIVDSFSKVKQHEQIFGAGVSGVRLLLKEAGIPGTANAHDAMLDLLVGTSKPSDAETHQQMAQEMIRVFESQKLVSLKTILDLSDHLDAMAKGEKFSPATVNRLQARMQEIQLPRASLTGVEKNALSFGYWTERHIENQRKLNLKLDLERAGADAGKLNDARAKLAPVLRDTLVGFNYLYYAPPGAQLLKTNPLFVRSHDFLGVQGTNQTWRQTEVLGTGWPSSAGGRLVGSLAGLPYALAEAEQNFLVPTREQALIWGDLVPQMIVMAKVPRWWNATQQQLHWVGLHIRLGETRVAESAIDAEARKATLETLSKQAAPARAATVGRLLEAGDLSAAYDNITAAELFQIGAEQAANKSDYSPFAREIRALAAASPNANSYAAISRVFGTPKPTLTTSFRPELLNLRTFPTLMGYSSRIMAETWESNVLYYAALADELHLPPASLNVRIPEWTQATVERIFATHLEDWPALLRSLRGMGEDVRVRARKERAAGE